MPSMTLLSHMENQIENKTEQSVQNTQKLENQKPKTNRGPTLRIIPLGGME